MLLCSKSIGSTYFLHWSDICSYIINVLVSTSMNNECSYSMDIFTCLCLYSWDEWEACWTSSIFKLYSWQWGGGDVFSSKVSSPMSLLTTMLMIMWSLGILWQACRCFSFIGIFSHTRIFLINFWSLKLDDYFVELYD